jgi:hypothetical protein
MCRLRKSHGRYVGVKKMIGRANDVRQDLGLGAFLPGAFVKAFVYFPLILTGYAITRVFLPKTAEGYYWVGSIILLAVMIYCVLMFLKGMLLQGICQAYTCLSPTIIAYDFLRGRVPYPFPDYGLSALTGFWV